MGVSLLRLAVVGLSCLTVNSQADGGVAELVLGAWTNLPASFLHWDVCFHNSTVVVNNHLYHFLGGGQRQLVHYAKIRPDGTLGEWKKTTEIPADCGNGEFRRTAVHENRIYVLGGHCKAEAGWVVSDVVAYAEVNPDGTLCGWRKTTPLPEPRCGGAAVVVKDKLYYLGGFMKRAVWFAQIGQDGQLGAWKATTPLLSPKAFFNAFMMNGFIYVMGGNGRYPPDGVNDTVFKAKITEDGSLRQWKKEVSLPEPRADYTAVFIDSQIFVFGGYDSEGKGKVDVFSTVIDKEGNLGKWKVQPPLPRNLYSFGAACDNGVVYLTGGFYGKDNKREISTETYVSRTQELK